LVRWRRFEFDSVLIEDQAIRDILKPDNDRARRWRGRARHKRDRCIADLDVLARTRLWRAALRDR